MSLRWAVLTLLAIGAAGCGGGSGDGDDGKTDGSKPTPPPGREASAEDVIRGWNKAVNAGEHERAADLFAIDAVVEQAGVEIRLRTRADAVDFNDSLPCRAEVTEIEPEGDASVVDFDLREGADGGCPDGGRAAVRFVIRDGKIREWRQLPPPEVPEGQTAGVLTL